MASKTSGEADNIRDGDSELQQQRASASAKQLCLLLKLYQEDPLPSDYVPHVTGSLDFLGAWDSTKSVPMEKRAMTVWELSFLISGDQDAMEFKYLLKSRLEEESYIVESGPNRVLNGGRMKRDATPIATFELPSGDGVHEQRLEFRVTIEADAASPFALARSWRLQHKKNNTSHYSRGSTPSTGLQPLDVDLHRYEGPTSEFAPEVQEVPQQRQEYGANAIADAKDPKDSGSSLSPISRLGRLGLTESKNRIVSVKDLVVLGEGGESTLPDTPNESAAGTDPFSPRFKEDNGVYVDEGVGSSRGRRVKPETVAEQKTNKMAEDSHNEVDEEAHDMPQAAGAVAAAAVADRLLGPKERRQLAIVLVGLPARGKTFTAAKLTRYLRWLGHDTKHFNVGKYRRLNYGVNQTADFFRGDNPEGVDKRNEVAVLAMEDMLSWMGEGGQVGVFDATNSTNERRNLLLKLAEGKCTVIFLETICTDPAVIDQNIRLKIQQSPDYAEISDYEAAQADFKSRLENYERVYETVTKGSYIKMIDMVSDTSCQLQVSNISGYLPGRIVFFLVNCHLTPRPILLTRHGESVDNVAGRIGGDTNLSETGEKYALKLAEFVNERLKNERTASIWTSTLTRSISSARHISGFPKVQWRALDEINVGVCDGMTYAEIEERMREEASGRSQDKLRYRYPRGESYLDVIQRLEPVIIELERQKSPVVVIAHQAVLRALYAYFADKPLKEVPHLQVPLHTTIEIQMGVTGVEEKRYKLM